MINLTHTTMIGGMGTIDKYNVKDLSNYSKNSITSQVVEGTVVSY